MVVVVVLLCVVVVVVVCWVRLVACGVALYRSTRSFFTKPSVSAWIIPKILQKLKTCRHDTTSQTSNYNLWRPWRPIEPKSLQMTVTRPWKSRPYFICRHESYSSAVQFGHCLCNFKQKFLVLWIHGTHGFQLFIYLLLWLFMFLN